MPSASGGDEFAPRITNLSNFAVDPASFLRQHYVTHENVVNPQTSGPVRHFAFDSVQVETIAPNGGSREAIMLRQKPAGEPGAQSAYWVPQGGYLDIPKQPNTGSNEHRYVFTPDFSGCHLLVDEVNSATLRVYHLEGCDDDLKLRRQYLANRDPAQHRFLTAMTARDYRDAHSPKAVAFMAHENGRWNIHLQRQNIASLGKVNGRLVTSTVLPGLRDVAGTANHEVIPVPTGDERSRPGIEIGGAALNR